MHAKPCHVHRRSALDPFRDQLTCIGSPARFEIRSDHRMLNKITLRTTAADAHRFRQRPLKQRYRTVPVASGESAKRRGQRRDDWSRGLFAGRYALP